MKKIFAFLIVSMMLLGLVGCTKTSQTPTTPTTSTESITTTEPTANQYYFSPEDWINQHKDSTDPTDIALIRYREAISAYVSAHPEVQLRSDWGIDYSGELSILTDLGVAGLPGLLKELDDANNPFVIPMIFAIEGICKTNISFIDTFSPEQISNWKIAFNNEPNNAKNIIANVVETLKNNASVSDEEIYQIADAGIFALPYFYNEVINNSNVSLLKYADKILPDEKLKEFNLVNGSQDSATYRKALESSIDDINIINNLVAK